MAVVLRWLALLGAMGGGVWDASARAEDDSVLVVTAPGGSLDRDDALTIDAAAIARAGTPDLFGALTRQVAGVSLQDAQGNPWQPNLVYRGFTASPLQGQAQGLAVYLDGARFNLPFGDTVPFDFMPEAALARVTLLDASPVYGLNALGGALTLETKTGRSDPGVAASVTGGRFGYAETSVSAGFAKDAFSAFAALQYSHDDGWRDHSPSSLYNGYLDLGWDGARAGLHLKAVGADTDLTGNGVAPVELLAVDRRAVFTWPDNSRGRYGRVSLHPWVALSDESRIEASLYAQRLTLKSLNGDSADIEACEDDAALLCLEPVNDDADESVLTDAAGAVIAALPDDVAYGVLNRGRTRTKGAGMLVQFVDRRPLGGEENHFVLGFSLDASRTRFGTSTEIGTLTDSRSVAGLGRNIVQADGAIAPVSLVARTRYWGVFVQDRLPLAPGLTAEIGLRYNHARVALDDRIGTALDGRHRFNRVNPGIELDYEVSEQFSLRAGYAESNRAPTPAELSCADENAPCSLANFFVADPPLKQVVAKSWELGASGKADIGGWVVEGLLSAYRTANRNDIQYVASEIRGRAYFRNIGATRRQGVELGVTAKRAGWTAMLSYALTDATYRAPLMVGSPSHPLADADGQIAVVRGNRLPGVPRHSAALALDYRGDGWSLGGDVIARSGSYLVGDEANLTPKLTGYAIVNLRGSVDLLPGVALFAEMKNALDRKYATFGTFGEVDEVFLAEAPDAANPRTYGPGAPRRWYAGVRARF